MLKLITVLMLNMWAIPADDILSPSINILAELEKITNLESRMKSMENEMEQLKIKNTAQELELKALNVQIIERKIKMDELVRENLAQAKKLEALDGTMNVIQTKTDEVLSQNYASKVAFSTSLLSSHGPLSSLHTLIYKHIFLNVGNAYDASTGIFTAPMRGVYMFVVFSKAYGGREKAVVAGLFKNNEHVFSTYSSHDGGFISASNGVSLLLEKEDRVYVNLYPGYYIFDNEHHHSTFSGHLLFQMRSDTAQISITKN